MLVFNQRNFFDSEVQPELSGGVQPEERTPAVCVEGRRLIHSANKPDIYCIVLYTYSIIYYNTLKKTILWRYQ